MPKEGADFDRMQDRQEEREDAKFSAKLAVEELGALKAQRVCVFFKESEEVLHGRLLGVLAELDSLVIRDFRPTRQALRVRQLVPYDNVEHLCVSEDASKCKLCNIYAELTEVMTKEPGNDQKDGDASNQNIPDASGAPGNGPAGQVG